MSESEQRVCVGCGDGDDAAHLDRCPICRRFFCSDCSVRGLGGRRFCSAECSRAYYFTGDNDDDEDTGND